jgi:predicted DNA-binding protein
MPSDNSGGSPKNQKTNISAHISSEKAEKLDNYSKSTGITKSDIISAGIDLFFENLERGNNKIVEKLEITDIDKTVLIPVSLYIKMKDSTFVQVKNMEKSKKIRIVSLKEKGREDSSVKYVALTEGHPDFVLSKVTLQEEKLKHIEKQYSALKEEFLNKFEELANKK